MKLWIIDSDNLGQIRIAKAPEGVTVIAASVKPRLLPVIGGNRVGKVVPVGPQASDFRLVADTAVMLSSNHVTRDSILRVYTCDKGLANGIRQLANQYQMKFQWHKRYSQ